MLEVGKTFNKDAIQDGIYPVSQTEWSVGNSQVKYEDKKPLGPIFR